MEPFFFISWIVLSIVAGIIGDKRKIGFVGAFFLSLFLSPIIGLIITCLSKSLSTEKHESIMLEKANEQSEALRQISKVNYTDELIKLKQLLDADILTKEEFEVEKEKLKSKVENEDKTFIGIYISSDSKYRNSLKVAINNEDEFLPVPVSKENARIVEVFDGHKIEVRMKIDSIFFGTKAVILEGRKYSTVKYDLDTVIKKI